MDEVVATATLEPATWVMGALFIILGGFAAYWMNRKKKGASGSASKGGDGNQRRN